MGNYRELELAAIDKRIEVIENEKEQISKAANVAKAIVRLESNEDYKLAIETSFLKEETEGIMSHLAGDQHLSEEMVEGMNKALNTIRSYKAFIKDTKELGNEEGERLAACDSRIAEERAYRIEVFEGRIDLGDQDG